MGEGGEAELAAHFHLLLGVAIEVVLAGELDAGAVGGEGLHDDFALKLTAPGVPDIYQGTELWDLSVVDPDNRRPVDFAQRQTLLAALDVLTPEAILARADEGLPKLHVIRAALAARALRPDACSGDHVPIEAIGPKAQHVVAFTRGGAAITIVPRLVWRLGDDWGETRLPLPLGRWRDVIGGGTAESDRLADLLGRFPVALLLRADSSE